MGSSLSKEKIKIQLRWWGWRNAKGGTEKHSFSGQMDRQTDIRSYRGVAHLEIIMSFSLKILIILQ